MKKNKQIILIFLVVLWAGHFAIRFSEIEIEIKILYMIGAVMTFVIATIWAQGGFQWPMIIALLVLLIIDFFIGALMYCAADVSIYNLVENHSLVAQTIVSEVARLAILSWLFKEVREELDKKIAYPTVT